MSMGVSLSAQIISLLYALALGTAAALLYDLLRAIRMHRRRSRALTNALDTLYCLLLAALCFAFALHIGGGELRLYMLFAAIGGTALYFLLFSRFLRPLWDFWAETLFALLRLLRLPIHGAKTLCDKLTKLCKRLFLFFQNCFIIALYRQSARRAYRRNAMEGAHQHGRKAEKARKRVHRDRNHRTADDRRR